MNIPRRALGFVYKQSNVARMSLVNLTAYLDFTCERSKQAFPIIVDLADKLEEKNFELVVQSFSLPYNRNSHALTVATHVINKSTNGTGVFPFIKDIYGRYDSLTTSATRFKTDEQVMEIILPLAAHMSEMTVDKFKEELSNRSYDMAARLDFKYSCTRGIFTTPTFMVNEIVMDASSTWTVQDWLSVIDPLL